MSYSNVLPCYTAHPPPVLFSGSRIELLLKILKRRHKIEALLRKDSKRFRFVESNIKKRLVIKLANHGKVGKP